eukprot:TRINITY_DN10339_c0_g1_i1.p1 TRINITY_DN10339_c0_g1~~TRINITY_DN10339_c0_g1_i1.p1  ORF type:complete len:272 (+),score=71.47 TRINITY_DN10339_c0_g1_i1:28-816(+)
MITGRASNVFLAKVAEQAEAYPEMVDLMKKVIEDNANLDVDERNLLSVAYKNVISNKRTGWRIISSLEGKEKSRDSSDEWKLNEFKVLRKKVEDQLHEICGEILSLVKDTILPAVPSVEGTDEKEEREIRESLVFWHKMIGDYYRYIAEFESDEAYEKAKQDALDAYNAAMEASVGEDKRSLKCTNAILLGLALNFSVFYYEILNDKNKACELAQKYFDEAITQLDSLEGDEYKDTTLIMQLLRDNLSLWTTTDSEEYEDSS